MKEFELKINCTQKCMKSYNCHQETSHASNYMLFKIHQFQSNKVLLYQEHKILTFTSGF
jgi:hypothetical protein